jgi:HD-GYP domain-containing protein (c-di-GMP phosphodiesterase class II)
MGVERALAEIEGGAGSQFDPEVVRVFVQMIREDPPTLPHEDEGHHSAHAG